MPADIPVYNQTPTVGNRPYGYKDAQGNLIEDSFGYLAFLGDYNGGTNLIYKGFARPGASAAAAVWQIALITYDGNNNITMIQWPQNLVTGKASSDFEFIWNNRASLNYS